jgi:hypothetical protein
MQSFEFEVEGTRGELTPEEVAAIDAVEAVLKRYQLTPLPLIGGKSRRSLAVQCALSALAASRDTSGE